MIDFTSILEAIRTFFDWLLRKKEENKEKAEKVDAAEDKVANECNHGDLGSLTDAIKDLGKAHKR